ncbi:alpha/beta hydrolase, partial [Thermodesulfobacteriota bacterium]
MKRSLFILWTLLWVLMLPFHHVSEAQIGRVTLRYKIEQNLLYYEKTSEALTEYMRARCRLDLYYPERYTNFPTVVWFHGGGLREGERHVPNPLKNQKIAVAAVDYRLYPRVHCPAYIEDAAAAVAWVFK